MTQDDLYPFCPACGVRYTRPSKCVCQSCYSKRWRDIHDPKTAVHSPPMPIVLFVEVHVGFLCILETNEELARLRGEPVKQNNSVAYSKIEKDNSRIPEPIDRVAHRVFGG